MLADLDRLASACNLSALRRLRVVRWKPAAFLQKPTLLDLHQISFLEPYVQLLLRARHMSLAPEFAPRDPCLLWKLQFPPPAETPRFLQLAKTPRFLQLAKTPQFLAKTPQILQPLRLA